MLLQRKNTEDNKKNKRVAELFAGLVMKLQKKLRTVTGLEAITFMEQRMQQMMTGTKLFLQQGNNI